MYAPVNGTGALCALIDNFRQYHMFMANTGNDNLLLASKSPQIRVVHWLEIDE
jgi:hypothetical protein